MEKDSITHVNVFSKLDMFYCERSSLLSSITDIPGSLSSITCSILSNNTIVSIVSEH